MSGALVPPGSSGWVSGRCGGEVSTLKHPGRKRAQQQLRPGHLLGGIIAIVVGVLIHGVALRFGDSANGRHTGMSLIGHREGKNQKLFPRSLLSPRCSRFIATQITSLSRATMTMINYH